MCRTGSIRRNGKQGQALQVAVQFRLELRDEDLVTLDYKRWGETGTVNRVQHRTTNVVMARKVYRKKPNHVRDAIVRELQVMHDCISKYIINFFGVFLNNEGDIITCMEYMDVGSLYDISVRFGPVRVDILGKIAQAVLSAIIYLYEDHRIMHRDLRPSHILLNSRGEIKLCDFGASTILHCDADTQVGSFIYRAPERVLGTRYSVKAEIWSFGVTVMELAIGNYPFDAQDKDDDESSELAIIICHRIVHEPSPKLPGSAAFPKCLEEMVDKCLVKEARDRPTLRELYENDAFILAAKRTHVDLVEWARSMLEHSSGSPKCHEKSLQPCAENTSYQGRYPRAYELNIHSAEDATTIDAFLGALQRLISMNSLEARKKHNVFALCPRCKHMLQQDVNFYEASKSGEEKEVDYEARETNCRLCQMICDSLPPVANSPSPITAPPSDSPLRPNDAISRVMKVGPLDEYMHTVMKIGSQYEDLNTGSHCAFQIAAGWMNVCLTRHERCARAMKHVLPALPTRVVDVGPSDGSQHPRLHAGGAERALYFTLSYRWIHSKDAGFQTTMSTLEAYKCSIPLGALPEMIQDAIFITRKFNIRYLWIDALCIIQDSGEDWLAEAKEMAKIYKNSLMTIAATADHTEKSKGIFRTRSRLQTRPFDCNHPWPGNVTKYVFADRRDTRDGSRPLSNWDTRAWILQEQVLSPRVLSFSGEELFWDCVSLNSSETFPDGIPGIYDADLKLLDVRLLKEAIFSGGQTTISRQQFYTAWTKIVEEYSERQMTKETDKLAALLGLAKEAAVFLGDEFLLGLWKRRLWRDLLWWVKDPAQCILPESFVAPTWSWASVNAPISFKLHGRDEGDIDPCVRIVDTEVELNQTLPVLRGRITAHGKLLTVSQRSEDAPKHFSHGNFSAPTWREDLKGAIPDTITCLIIAASKSYVYTLGLVSVDDVGHYYKRVGLVSWKADVKDIGWNRRFHEWESYKGLKTVTIL